MNNFSTFLIAVVLNSAVKRINSAAQINCPSINIDYHNNYLIATGSEEMISLIFSQPIVEI